MVFLYLSDWQTLRPWKAIIQSVTSGDLSDGNPSSREFLNMGMFESHPVTLNSCGRLLIAQRGSRVRGEGWAEKTPIPPTTRDWLASTKQTVAVSRLMCSFWCVCFLSAATVWLPNLRSIKYIYLALCLFRYIVYPSTKSPYSTKCDGILKQSLQKETSGCIRFNSAVKQSESSMSGYSLTVTSSHCQLGKVCFLLMCGCVCMRVFFFSCLFSCVYLKAAAGLKSLHMLRESLVYVSTGED